MGADRADDILSLMKNSAPGKIILVGEHAVVYNRPALAMPVTQVHADVEVNDSARDGIWIHAADVNLDAELASLPSDHPIGCAISNIFQRFDISPRPALEIKISSTIPVASGLGSGAAVTVALTRALASHLHLSLTDEQVSDMAFEIEKIHHGSPSGIDNAVIAYAKPIYFTKDKPIQTFAVGAPFTIVIGDTGIPAPTKQSVSDVRRLWLRTQNAVEEIFNEIAQISIIARRVIESGQPELLGEYINQNHILLQQLTVSSPELDALVEAALKAGASGAKMSGGGRGGNMIALVEKEKAETVASALVSAGAKRTIVTEVR